MALKRNYAIVDAPSILGLRPTGVELLPETLRQAGLQERLNAEYYGAVSPLVAYDGSRDKMTKLLNPKAIKDYSTRLAETMKLLLHDNKFPIVLGGDCSILIGNVLALRRLGRYGLFFCRWAY